MSRPICRRQSLYALFRQRQGGGDCLRCALHTAVQCRYEGQPAGGAARCCRSAGPIWNKHEECGTHAIRTCSSITGAAWNAVQEHHTPESALRPKPRPDETERGLKHSAEHRPPKPALRPEPLPDETERSIKHSAEHRPPKPALRPELRPGETERGIKHSVEHRLRKDAPSSENRSGKYAAPKTSYSDVRPRPAPVRSSQKANRAGCRDGAAPSGPTEAEAAAEAEVEVEVDFRRIPCDGISGIGRRTAGIYPQNGERNSHARTSLSPFHAGRYDRYPRAEPSEALSTASPSTVLGATFTLSDEKPLTMCSTSFFDASYTTVISLVRVSRTARSRFRPQIPR